MVSTFKRRIRSQSLIRNWLILQPTIKLMCLFSEVNIERKEACKKMYYFLWNNNPEIFWTLCLKKIPSVSFSDRRSVADSYHNSDPAGLPATRDLALSWLLMHPETELMHSCCSCLKGQLLPIAVLLKEPLSIHCSIPAVWAIPPGLCDPDEITAFELQTDLTPPASSPSFLHLRCWFLKRKKSICSTILACRACFICVNTPGMSPLHTVPSRGFSCSHHLAHCDYQLGPPYPHTVPGCPAPPYTIPSWPGGQVGQALITHLVTAHSYISRSLGMGQ